MKVGQALMQLGLAGLGGGLGYGVNWGVSHIKVGALPQTLIFAGLGVGGSVALALLGAGSVGLGLAGSTTAITIGRIRLMLALAELEKGKEGQKEAGAVYGLPPGVRANPRAYHQAYDAGAVYRQVPEAGAVAIRQGGAQSLMPYQPIAPGFKEAGASEYIPGPVRWFGPHSWAYSTDAGAVVKRYRSAHSSG